MSGNDDFTDDDDYYDSDYAPGISKRKWIGAILALLIVGGFGVGIWYAYDQGVKKGVQLAPPIISADSSPVKEKPDDPGGMDIPNQDKQVFSVLQSGEAPEKVEKLMPPPEEATADSVPADSATDEKAPSDAEQAIDVKKLETLIEKASEPTAAKAVEEAAPVKEAPAVEEKVVVAAAPVPKKAEAPAASGTTYRVQLGSFRDADSAEKQWVTLQKKFKSLLGGVSYRVENTTVKDKGTFHRLQAGAYQDRSSAIKLCEELKAQKQDCLVVSG
ncbi:MAG: SPOR domain-containing protein [Sneathiella sp.]|nr:SPOR domain-containing protein [Sneathiella sp.]